jgi:hypothetical protein
MNLGDYTGQGGGFSKADQSMAASGTTGSVSSGFSVAFLRLNWRRR